VLVPPETFSSELRDVHERRGVDRDSFNDEFRGASDSLIAKERPPLVGGRGRGAVVALVVTLMLPLLLGGGIALWVWKVEIGNWLAGNGPQVEPAVAPEPSPEANEQAVTTPTPDPPPEPAVERVFGIRGAPDPSEPDPTPEPAQPDPPAQPTPSSNEVEAVSTTVRGNVASTAVNANLDKVDAALVDCWAKAGVSGPVELELSFGITHDGDLQAVSLRGGSEALQACVRLALPTSSWPQPRNAGETSVTRTWKLGG
jgi:hypothetical protein